MRSFLGTNNGNRAGTKQTSQRVDLVEYEIETFRQLNPDERLIKEKAERIRAMYAELRDLTSEEAVALKMKIDHLERIQTYLKSGTNVVKTAGVLLASDDSKLLAVLNILTEHRPDISLELMRWFPTDFQIEEDSDKVNDRKVIVSQAKKLEVASFLKKFQVPEGIATDVAKVYRGEVDPTNISALLIGIATRIVTGKNEEKVDSSNFTKVADPDAE